MAKWKIELRNVGPERTAETMIVDAASLVKAKQHAAHGCRKHLAAGGNIYLEARGHYTYCIILDMEEVGEATIACLEAQPRAAHGSRKTPNTNPGTP